MGALTGDPGADAEEGAHEDGGPASFDQLLRRAAAARAGHAEDPGNDQPGTTDDLGEDGTDRPGGTPG